MDHMLTRSAATVAANSRRSAAMRRLRRRSLDALAAERAAGQSGLQDDEVGIPVMAHHDDLRPEPSPG
jgi:hypothetical protein